MKIPCGMIRDLLPLYIDEVCSEESRALLAVHLEECVECRACFENMRGADDGLLKGEADMKMADGLKKLKYRMNRMMMIAVFSAVFAVLAVFLGFQALCVQPLKELGPEEVSAIAEVYEVDKLPLLDANYGEESVVIRKGEDDLGSLYSIQIPAMPEAEITMTENVLNEAENITVIEWTSKYHIRLMTWKEGMEKDTLYIDAIKTTLLKNRPEEKFETQKMIELRKIDKIVYVGKNGRETVMWEAPQEAGLEKAE